MIELRRCLKYEWAWCDGDCEHCQAVFTTSIVPPYIQDQMKAEKAEGEEK